MKYAKAILLILFLGLPVLVYSQDDETDKMSEFMTGEEGTAEESEKMSEFMVGEEEEEESMTDAGMSLIYVTPSVDVGYLDGARVARSKKGYSLLPGNHSIRVRYGSGDNQVQQKIDFVTEDGEVYILHKEYIDDTMFNLNISVYDDKNESHNMIISGKSPEEEARAAEIEKIIQERDSSLTNAEGIPIWKLYRGRDIWALGAVRDGAISVSAIAAGITLWAISSVKVSGADGLYNSYKNTSDSSEAQSLYDEFVSVSDTIDTLRLSSEISFIAAAAFTTMFVVDLVRFNYYNSRLTEVALRLRFNPEDMGLSVCYTF